MSAKVMNIRPNSDICELHEVKVLGNADLKKTSLQARILKQPDCKQFIQISKEQTINRVKRTENNIATYQSALT